MSVILPLIGGNLGGAWTPPIEQSVIFDGAAYLSRTPGSAGNRRIYTWAAWVRRSEFGVADPLFTADSSLTDYITFLSGDTLSVYFGGGGVGTITTTRVFRDIGWYHFAVVVDTTQATASDRVKIYVNGSLVTDLSSTSYPSLNYDCKFNSTVIHYLGREGGGTTFSGAMDDIHFLDGTALSQAQIQSTFLDGVVFDGQTSPAPKAVTGLTYGTNGFHLAFADSANFGDDTSGNGNDWTPTGFVAGDQTADVPGRPYGLWNAIWPSTGAISDGGRTTAGLGTSQLFMPTGKFYWEITANAVSVVAGVVSTGGTATTTGVANGTTSGFRFDADAGTLDVTTDGVNYTSVGTGLTGGRFIRSSGGSNTINSGLTAFTHTPPTGFLPLHAGNLPTPEHHPQNYIAVGTRTGTGAAYSVTNGPANGTDFLWGKGRSGATDHYWYDIVRGVQKQLESNTTTAETTEATGLTAFNATGYSGGALAQMNTSAATYVDLMLKAGGAGVANTDGTIASTVSVAAPGHFGVAQIATTGAAGSFGHGMSGQPEFIVGRMKNTTATWIAYAAPLGSANRLVFSGTGAAAVFNYWGTGPTSTVINLGTETSNINVSGNTAIFWYFRSIPGVCKVWSATGNLSTDGFYVDCGFTPRWIIGKNTGATGRWWIHDTARDPINLTEAYLAANSTAVEATDGNGIDVLSSGFKMRSNNSEWNGSGNLIVGVALADIPGGGDLPWPLAR